MFAAKSDVLLRYASASVISFYQRRLSPLQGYFYAHRVLHGDDSSSRFVKDLVLQIGPRARGPDPDEPRGLPGGARGAARRRLPAQHVARQAEAWREPLVLWLRRSRDDVDDACVAFEDLRDGDSWGCGPESVDCGFCNCGP